MPATTVLVVSFVIGAFAAFGIALAGTIFYAGRGH